MDLREQLHDALDAEDFPSHALLTRSVAALDRPRSPRRYGRLASLTAALVAVALIATLVAIRVNSVSSVQPTLSTSTTIDNLVDIHFVSRLVGFAQLHAGDDVFAMTSDGGKTWRQVLRVHGLAGTQMQWLDVNNGVVVGQRGHAAVVWRTSDGGLRWQSHLVPAPLPDSTFETAYFLDPLHGWVVYRYQADCGGCGLWAQRFVFETNDGGAQWTEVRGVSAPALGAAERQLTFFTSSWGVLSSPTAFYQLDVTHDGGRTWQESAIPGFTGRCQVMCEVNERQTHLFFADDKGLMAIASCLGEAGTPGGEACYKTYPFQPTEAHLYRTADGGLTWTYVRDLPLSTGSIYFIDPQRAMNIGPAGVSWTFDAGATWSSPAATPVPSGWYVYMSQFTDAARGWLALTNSSPLASVGTGNAANRFQLLATTDGGRTWRHVSLPRA